MSKEIRRVPPNWEHPKEKVWADRHQKYEDRYISLYDQCAQEAFDEWLESYMEWRNGGMAKAMAEDPELEHAGQLFKSFCYNERSPIDPDKYRPSWDESTATWYQVYQTVSEGTPLTPPFETQDELINYLVNNGDFWGDRWSAEAANNFVKKDCWQPSASVINGAIIDLSKTVV